MKFSRSFIGYAQSQVDEELYNLHVKLGEERRALIEEYNQAVREHNLLLTQHNALRSNLESARATAALMSKYEHEHRQHILQSIHSTAKQKIDSIKSESDAVIAEIDERSRVLDNYANSLIGELSNIVREIEALAVTIQADFPVSEEIVATDAAIERYRELAANEEPFTVFTPEVAKALMPLALREAGNALQGVELSLTSQTKLMASPQVVSAIAPPSKASEQVMEPPTSAQNGRPIVLIAENDRDTSALLASIVEREGYDTFLVVDGYALNNMLKAMEPPALVLVDSLLPYMDITHFIRDVRQSELWCKVPIMVLTAAHSKHSIIQALEAGANDSLEKPFNPRELAARVKSLTKTVN